MARLSKKQKAARDGLDPTASYGSDEAVAMVKARATAKFDETIEMSMNLGVDPRHSDQTVRGMISLPTGTAFIMWLGEQITERGIGNGISLIIFAGIVGDTTMKELDWLGGYQPLHGAGGARPGLGGGAGRPRSRAAVW